MDKYEILLIAGAMLTILIGATIAFGSSQLWNGAPATWPDVVASASTVRTVARVMLVVAVILALAGIGATLGRAWGLVASAVALAIFVIGGFLANYTLFGDFRLAHTGTNLVVAVIVVCLLWSGYAGARG
jgi:hypothetical protein